MGKDKEKFWLRLRRAFKRVVLFPQRGDGGAHSDKFIQVTKPPTDSSFVIKDTAVIAYPKKQ